MTSQKRGYVYLVGAGPGDPGLITVKAVKCLQKADAVVYDYLANPQLLRHAPAAAARIYVGKKGGDHTLSQEEINQLIIDLAQSGKTVVRLKGGDPYIFGRGGEEAQELVAAGVAFEVIPGISSVVAAPAYAGIPLTHRAHNANVGLITGHEDPAKPESSLDWPKIANSFGALVFVMGVKNLPDITANLINGGRDPETPAAVIRWGATPDQQTVIGVLGDIAEKTRAAGIKPPAVFIVGGVVGLRDELNWYEKLPLFGRRILVTRTRAQASRLVEGLADLGAWPLECPTIQLHPPEDWSEVDAAVSRLKQYDWVVLTSPNGVDFFFQRLKEKGLDARALAGARIAGIGPATAERLAENGIAADLTPKQFVAESLVEAMSEAGVQGKRILLARAAEARAVLPKQLAEAGGQVDEVALYRTLPPEVLPEEALEALKADRVDLVTFTSSSTVTNMIRLLDMYAPGAKEKIKAACIGPITAETARENGLNVVVNAAEYTIDGLVEAIRDYATL
jgi:uroporphyrinogen III methyltransferase/synthase